MTAAAAMLRVDEVASRQKSSSMRTAHRNGHGVAPRRIPRCGMHRSVPAKRAEALTNEVGEAITASRPAPDLLRLRALSQSERLSAST